MAETPNRITRNAMAELEAGKGERFDIAELYSEVKFSRYDSAHYLETEEDFAGYLDAVMEEGGSDPAYVARALGVVARARNLSQIARDVGMSRQGLVKALSGEGNPSFATVLKVAQVLGLRMAFEPAQKAASEKADTKRERPKR